MKTKSCSKFNSNIFQHQLYNNEALVVFAKMMIVIQSIMTAFLFSI